MRAIIFDAGDVLLKGDFPRFVSKACTLLGIPKIKVAKGHPIGPGLNKGTKGHKEEFETFFKTRIDDSQFEKLCRLWDMTWKPDKRMFKLADKLAERYLVAVLTNSDSRYEAIAEREGWYRNLHAVIYSHKLGMIKPDHRIYLLATDKLGVRPEQCVFIDDVEENVKGAEQVGMKGILFKNIDQLKEEIKRNQ